MNTLIVYATKHGCAAKCAARVAAELPGEVVQCNLKKGPVPDPARFDTVVIGGSIYMGRIQKEVSAFCKRYLGLLQDKKVALYICGMAEGETAAKQIGASFPQELLAHAAAKESFGGEFILGAMNPFERFIVKKAAKIDHDMSNIAAEKISGFVRALTGNESRSLADFSRPKNPPASSRL